MNTYYHVTEKKNLNNILAQGLIPQIGSRSAILDEDKAVFLFKTLDDMENALLNWLGEELGDEVEVVSLKIELPQGFPILNDDCAEFECVSKVLIEPKYISFFKEE